MKKCRTLSIVTAIMLVGVVSIAAEEVMHDGMMIDDGSMIEAQMDQEAEVVEKPQGNAEEEGLAISATEGDIQPEGTESSGQTYYGLGAGTSNTALNVAFFGSNAGNANTTGAFNTFVGQAAGFKNTTGQYNTFSGQSSGNQNTTAHENTFYGSYSGK